MRAPHATAPGPEEAGRQVRGWDWTITATGRGSLPREVTGPGVRGCHAVVGVDVDVGVASLDGRDQGAQWLSGERADEFRRRDGPVGDSPLNAATTQWTATGSVLG